MRKHIIQFFSISIFIFMFISLTYSGEFYKSGIYVPDINECKNTYMKWTDKSWPNKLYISKSVELRSLQNELKKTTLSIGTPNKFKWLSSNYRAQMKKKRAMIIEQIKVCSRELNIIIGLSIWCKDLLQPKHYGTFDETDDKIEELEEKIEELENRIDGLE
ncbi:MAG: hypothetical protein AUJ48_03825 [Deltaproteobacteria bacterium CG1_02_45_11]|nr:MAG: hypothetical protein AUJ48_03825 [Deltaproteobacteria bacterium CG1_02_45_11]